MYNIMREKKGNPCYTCFKPFILLLPGALHRTGSKLWQRRNEVIIMHRLFQTHNIRKSIPVPPVWDLRTLDPDKPFYSKIPVPSCIETIPGLASYKGKCKLECAPFFGGNIRLTFKGVSHTAEVLLDGASLGQHYGAYGEFSFVLKDLPYDNHVISVLADNSYGEESALHVENDYYSYGGITRPVVMEELGAAYVKWLHITPVLESGAWRLKLSACVENITGESLPLRLALALNNNDAPVISFKNRFQAGSAQAFPYTAIPVTVASHSEEIVSVWLDCPDVAAYTPENPVLYYVHALLFDGTDTQDGAAPMDDLIDRFGFREVKVSGTQILWNGEPMRIKGFNRHEDYAEFGCCVPLSAMARDIAIIKSTGANCIRTCHYPNDERFLDLCDENGLYIWEEAHARGLSEEQMRNPHFMEQSLLSVREMITWHYNHPSIYVWGLLNECASHTPFGRSCYEKLISEIRSLDVSRPVTYASCRFDNDICLDLVDIVSYNFYPGWYHNTPVRDFVAERYAWIQTTGGAGKPFLISEIGAGAIYGYRSETCCKWSEDYQCQALREQITDVLSFDKCSGLILWQYADCRVDESWFSNRPKSQNNKGIVDMYRRKKLAFQTVTELFQ